MANDIPRSVADLRALGVNVPTHVPDCAQVTLLPPSSVSCTSEAPTVLNMRVDMPVEISWINVTFTVKKDPNDTH